MKMDLNLVRIILWFSACSIISHAADINCRFCFKYYLESCDGTYRVEIGNLALSEQDLQFTKQCSNKPFGPEHGIFGETSVISSGLSGHNLLLVNGGVVGHRPSSGGESSVEKESDQEINTHEENIDLNPEKHPSYIGDLEDTDCDLVTNAADEHNVHYPHYPAGVKPDQNHRNSGEVEDIDGKIIVNTEEENPTHYPDSFKPNQQPNYDGVSVGTDSHQINTEDKYNVDHYAGDRKPDKHPNHDGGSVDTNIEGENAVSQPLYPNGFIYDLHHFYGDGSLEAGSHPINIQGENTGHEPYYSDIFKTDQRPIYGGGSVGTENEQEIIADGENNVKQPDFAGNLNTESIETNNQVIKTKSENTVHQQQYPGGPKPDQHPMNGGESKETVNNQPQHPGSFKPEQYPNYDKESIDIDNQVINTGSEIPAGTEPVEHSGSSLEVQNNVHQPQYPHDYSGYPGYSEGTGDIHLINFSGEYGPHYWDIYKPDQHPVYETEYNKPQHPDNQHPNYDKEATEIDNQVIHTASEITDHQSKNKVNPKPDEHPKNGEESVGSENNQPKYDDSVKPSQYPDFDKESIDTDNQVTNVGSENTDNQPQNPDGAEPEEHSSSNLEIQDNVHRPQYIDGFNPYQHPGYGEGALGHLINFESEYNVHVPHHWDVYKPNQYPMYGEGSDETENKEPQHPGNQYPNYDKEAIETNNQVIHTVSEVPDHQSQDEDGPKPDQHPLNGGESVVTDTNEQYDDSFKTNQYSNSAEESTDTNNQVINIVKDNTDNQPQIPDGPKPGEHSSSSLEMQDTVHGSQYPHQLNPDQHPGYGTDDIHLINFEGEYAVHGPHGWYVYNPNQHPINGGGAEGSENDQPQHVDSIKPNQYPSYDKETAETGNHQTQNEDGPKPDQHPMNGGESVETEYNQQQYDNSFKPNQYPNSDKESTDTDNQIINTGNENPQIPSGPKPKEHSSSTLEMQDTVHGPQYPHHLNPDQHPGYDVGSLGTDFHIINVEDEYAVHGPHGWYVYNPNQHPINGGGPEGTENNQPQHPGNQYPNYDKEAIETNNQFIHTVSEIPEHQPQNQDDSKPDQHPLNDGESVTTENNQQYDDSFKLNQYSNSDKESIDTDNQPQNPDGTKPGEHSSSSLEMKDTVHGSQYPHHLNPDQHPGYGGGSLGTDIHLINVQGEYAVHGPHDWYVYESNQHPINGEQAKGTDNQVIHSGSKITDDQPQNQIDPKPDQHSMNGGGSIETEYNQQQYDNSFKPNQHPNSDKEFIDTDNQVINTGNENPQIPSGPVSNEQSSTSLEMQDTVHGPQHPHHLNPDLHHGYGEGTNIHLIKFENEYNIHGLHDWDIYKHSQHPIYGGGSEGTENNQPQYPGDVKPSEKEGTDKHLMNNEDENQSQYQGGPKPEEQPGSDGGSVDTNSEIINTDSENTIYQPQDPSDAKPTQHPSHVEGSVESDKHPVNTEGENAVNQPQYAGGSNSEEHGGYGGGLVDTDIHPANTDDENTVYQQQYPNGFLLDLHHISGEGSMETHIHPINTEGQNTVHQPQYPDGVNSNQRPSNVEGSVESEIINTEGQNTDDVNPNQYPNYVKGSVESGSHTVSTEDENTVQKSQYPDGQNPDQHPNYVGGSVGIDRQVINPESENTVHQLQYPDGTSPSQYHTYGGGTNIHLINYEREYTAHGPHYWNNQHPMYGGGSVGTGNDKIIFAEDENNVNRPQYPAGFESNQHPIYGKESIETGDHIINTESENNVHPPQHPDNVKPNQYPGSGDGVVATDNHLIHNEGENTVNHPQYSGVFQPGQHPYYVGGAVGTDNHFIINTLHQQHYPSGSIPDHYPNYGGQQHYPNGFIPGQVSTYGAGQVGIKNEQVINTKDENIVRDPNGVKPDQLPSYGGGLVGTENQHAGSIEFAHTGQNLKYPDKSQPNHLDVGKYTEGNGHQSGNSNEKQSGQQVKEGTDRELELSAKSQLDSTENDQVGSQEVEIEHEINHVSYPEQSNEHMFGTSMDQSYLFKRPEQAVPVTGVMQYLQIPPQHKVVQHVVHHHVHIPTYPQDLSGVSEIIEKQKLADCLKKYGITCKVLLEDKFRPPETNWYKLYSKYGKPTQQIPVKDPYVDESGAKHFLFSQVYGPYAQQSASYIEPVPKLEQPSNVGYPEPINANSINALQLPELLPGKTEESKYVYPSQFIRPYMPQNNQENYQMIHPSGFMENIPGYNPYFSTEKSVNPDQMKSLNEFKHGSSGGITGSKGKIFHKIVKKIRLRTRRKFRGRFLRRNNDGSESYEDEDNSTENPNESVEYEGEEPETSEEEKNESDNTTEGEAKKE